VNVQDFFDLFGLHIEWRPTNHHAERVNSRSDISAVFDQNARDQAAGSYFFSRGERRRASLPDNSNFLRDGFASKSSS
jgi:hypothetical protein